MKNIFLILTALIFSLCCCNNKQENKEKDLKDLRLRFSGYLKAVSEMDIDEIQNYTYPKLFTVLSRNESRENMEKSYTFFKDKAWLDSVRIDSISPVFNIEEGSYAIAFYSMTVRMEADSMEITPTENPDTIGLKHTIGENYPAPKKTLFAILMRDKYSVEITNYQETGNMTTIRMRIMTIAIKDKFAKDWSFIRVTNDDELINKLFSKKVIEILVSYTQ